MADQEQTSAKTNEGLIPVLYRACVLQISTRKRQPDRKMGAQSEQEMRGNRKGQGTNEKIVDFPSNERNKNENSNEMTFLFQLTKM